MGIRNNVRNFMRKTFSKRDFKESKEHLFESVESIRKSRSRKWGFKLPRYRSRKKPLRVVYTSMEFDNPLSIGSNTSLPARLNPISRFTDEHKKLSEEALCDKTHTTSASIIKINVFETSDSGTDKFISTPNIASNIATDVSAEVIYAAKQTNEPDFATKELLMLKQHVEKSQQKMIMLESKLKELTTSAESLKIERDIAVAENAAFKDRLALQENQLKETQTITANIITTISLMEHKMNESRNLQEEQRKLQEQKIERLTEEVKKLKRKSRKGVMYFNKTNTCQVFTGGPDICMSSGTDETSTSSGSLSGSNSDRNDPISPVSDPPSSPVTSSGDDVTTVMEVST